MHLSRDRRASLFIQVEFPVPARIRLHRHLFSQRPLDFWISTFCYVFSLSTSRARCCLGALRFARGSREQVKRWGGRSFLAAKRTGEVVVWCGQRGGGRRNQNRQPRDLSSRGHRNKNTQTQNSNFLIKRVDHKTTPTHRRMQTYTLVF